jgi:hypothetical protein
MHDVWGLPSRRTDARCFSRFMLSRGLEPLRDGSTLVGTPEVLGLLFKTEERRVVLQFDATFLSPSVSLRANGSVGGLVPGSPVATQEPKEAPHDLEQLADVIEEATSSGSVAKCLHGLLIVSLDPLQAPILVAYRMSASGSMPAEIRAAVDRVREHLLARNFELCWPAFDGDRQNRPPAGSFTHGLLSDLPDPLGDNAASLLSGRVADLS